MGKRGRKQVVSASKTVAPGRPAQPTNLDPDSLAAWEKACEDLEVQGLLSTTDFALLEVYARTYGLWSRITRQLETEPLLKGSGERAYINPLCGQVSNLSGRIKTLLAELGLTPRNRKPTEKKTLVDPLEAICGTTLKLAE